MTSLWRHQRSALPYGRGILAAGVLAALVIAACSSSSKKSYTPAGTLFPLSKGNAWVFLQSGSGTDSLLDSIWINYDSIRTGAGGTEHWYSVRSTNFFGDNHYWIRRDSIGDLWCALSDFDSPSPFLLSSKIHGETWLFNRACVRADTVSLTDTTYAWYIPSGDLLQHVWIFAAKAGCTRGNWQILLARNYGPVGWTVGMTEWDLLRKRIKDDATDAASANPGYLLNPK
jgi:hypothetical protein